MKKTQFNENKAMAIAKGITDFFDSSVRKEGSRIVVVDGYGRRTVYNGIKEMLIDWKPTLVDQMAAGGADFSAEVKFINQFEAA